MSNAQASLIEEPITQNNLVYMPGWDKELEEIREKTTAEQMYEVGYRVAYRLLGNRDAAQDAAIETVTRVLEKELEDKDYACSYAARVAARLVISSWRKDATARKYAHILTPEAVASDQDKDLALLRCDLRQALAHLTRRQREIVVLRYVADMSEEAVSEALDCSIGTVKSTTHDALARLKNMVEVLP
jgi:RNA polymerase sigma factor (sigma-70 family)